MKNYFDSFYEIIHKNSVKRRRMISLLLVLSVFVSSGVLWELRDTVITMVNEPICGLKEHEHTDECYEYRLVCGLEENEEHTHTDECYEKVLVCGYEEHLHTTLCYTDEELTENSVQSDDEKSNIVSIALPEEENEELFISQADEAAAAALRLGNQMVSMLANETANPGTISTVDNIAKGINFTLFDYSSPDDALEGAQNNYDVIWDGQNWIHPQYDGNTNKRGWMDVGINSGKNPEDDIMFFAYGTPAFEGTIDNDDDNNTYNIYHRNVDSNGAYAPSKNNYAGDYNTNSTYTSQLSGNRPIQGIVKDQLDGGYPVMNNAAGHSLDYLFNDTDSQYKTVYTGVNHFLKPVVDSKGVTHLVYNSNENYAYFDTVSRNFTIYDSTYHIINKDHHRANDYNNLTDETYAQGNGYEMQIGFFPFDEYNINRRDPNFNGNGFNHHFGMKMDADFFNVGTTDKPVIFKYSGDDDMWVFVDGKLVLDIGGIHEPAEGLIDFTNGWVWVQDDIRGQSYSQIRAIEGMNTQLSSAELPNNFGDNDHKWIVTPIEDFLGSTWDDNAAEGHKHNIKMFYLERGGCYSNLSMDMTLPTVIPLSVTKNVDYNGHYSDDYDDADYSFTVYEEVSEGNYEVANLGTGTQNPFTLKAGERMDFYNIAETRKFYVVETGVNTNIFSRVDVNGAAKGTFGTPLGIADIASGNATALNQGNQYNFTNVVREETGTIDVTKSWLGNDGNPMTNPPTSPIKFKLYRSDNGGEPQPVEIGGKMTFTLNSPSWSWTSPVALPKRYGTHVYTYSVEELNVPAGYVASYGTDQSGDPTITNKDISKVDIYVKKNWINTAGADMTDIRLVLKRERATYSASEATSLKINLRDAGGNLLSTYEVSKNDGKVFAGGSVEFAFTAPNGVGYYTIDTNYPQLVPNTLQLRQISDRTFEISDLAADNGSGFANEVDIKVYTDEAEDSLLLLHHSFTKYTDGWIPNGGSEILTSENSAYAKGDGMLIRGPNDTNRTASNQGARLDLDPLIFKVNHTYTFSTYIKVDNYANNEGVLNTANNKKYVMFKFTLNDGLEKPDNKSYHQMDTVQVYAGEWTHLVGTVTLPEDINPYGMYLIVETFDPENSGFVGPGKFRMDEFTAIEGNHAVSVEQGTGKVTVGSGEYASYLYETGFDDGANGWEVLDYQNNGTTMDVVHDTGQYAQSYLLITGRNATNDGIMMNVPFLQKGHTYRFEAQVQGNNDDNARNINLTINLGAGVSGEQYRILGTADISQANNDNDHYAMKWITLNAQNNPLTIPDDADLSNMFIFFETPYSTDEQTMQTGSFRVNAVRITEVGLNTDKPGYTLSNGTYTSNYSQYGLTLDSESATNPLKLTSAYAEDTGFSRPITLSTADGNNWQYHWTKGTGANDIQEESGYRYRYYIEEQWIGDSSNTVVYDSTENIWKSNDDAYIVSYSGNMVETNEESNPIIVNNRSIRYRLPETGGSGTGRIYFYGFVLTAMGIISGSALYRRKRRRV